MTQAITTQKIDRIEQRLLDAQDLRREILNDLQSWHQKQNRRSTKGAVSQEMHSALGALR